ncbi:aminotransferase family protein [Metarhizium robertsii]|uniref:Aminotransferase swnA n=2 Tax=Metarhizium robertsii TaxID=568076 RepID=SWNA_METRA|nr:aromatic amino acid aminotransferase [Metarhizium robertsii ARSEF 23]E9F8L8.2 RecName: Full=Aminotransferase swnA; AltName: Full=Swainsonine biosynthesis gene cluster protein A [Metarhizium robertsii ARSEF 23]EFY95964.2 aromatic amino acid aminotransferase [Metarhizium robertsii ARSEF 23]EXU97977.1 aminotransferase family protein [Metarhizium robertsii]
MHLERDKVYDAPEGEVWSTVKPASTHNSAAPKRLAQRWNHRWSDESLTQGVSPLKDSSKTVKASTTIPLGTGRPTALYYPWQSVSMAGTEASRQPRGLKPTLAGNMTCSKGEAAFDLSSALNYGEPSGWSQLVAFFRETTGRVHRPPYADWDTTLTCGSTSAVDLVLRMFCNRGDCVLAERFTYPGTLMASRAQGLRTVGIAMDADGLVPEALDAALRGWDAASRGRKPFVLYTIPSGHNPTGVTQSAARKRAVYQVAERHDLLIVEDDPYFFLRLGRGGGGESLPTSYLSLDTAGRVVRVESTSKILAPGLRCGWLTASRQVVDMFGNFAEVGPSSPAGPSQAMLYKLLVESWGPEGFAGWLDYLSGEYGRRRDVMVAACERHLPREVCAWTAPTHGMFLWVGAALERHPRYQESGARDQDRDADADAELCRAVEDGICARAEANGVLVARGSWCRVGGGADRAFFRMTFVATAEAADLERGVAQFGRAVRDEFGLG